MPKFNKTVEELESRFDKWLYVIRNLNKLDRVPDKLREQIFEKVFETAEIAKFTPEQVLSYEDSLKYYRDLKNSLDTAKEEGFVDGFEEGIEKGTLNAKLEIAINLKNSGFTVSQISELTGLTEFQIQNIK